MTAGVAPDEGAGASVQDFAAVARPLLERSSSGSLRRMQEVIDSPAGSISVVGPPRSGRDTLTEVLRERLAAAGVTFTSGETAARVTLVVCDAGTRIGRDELDLIEAAPGTVLVAINKIDRHNGGQATEQDTQKTLAVAGHGDVPVFGVSGLLAAHGFAGSGMDELAHALYQAAADTGHAAATRRTARTLLVAELRDCAAARERAEHAGEIGQLRARRAELVRARTAARAPTGIPAETTALRSSLNMAKVELAHAVAGECRALSSEMRAMIDEADRVALKSMQEVLGTRLSVLSGHLERMVTARMRQLHPASAVQRPQDCGPLRPPRGGSTMEDRMMIALGASGGLGIGRLVVAPMSLVPALDLMTIPLTFLLGGLAGWWMVRARAQLAARARTRQWALETITDFRAHWERAVSEYFLSCEAAALGALTAAHGTRLRSIDDHVHSAEAQIAQADVVRRARIEELNHRMAELQSAIDSLGLLGMSERRVR